MKNISGCHGKQSKKLATKSANQSPFRTKLPLKSKPSSFMFNKKGSKLPFFSDTSYNFS